MRKTMLFAALFLLAFSVGTAWAQKDLKIGVVDVQEVLKSSEPGQKAMGELKDKFQDLKSDLEKQKAQLDKLQEEMQKQSIVLTQEAKADKELELKRKYRDFQDNYQASQAKMKAEEEKLTKPIFEVFVKVIKEFGEKNGYTTIVDTRGSGLVYADDSVDVTKQVIAELNQAWRAKK